MERSFDPADFDRRLEALLKRTLEQEKQIKAMSVGVRGAEAGPVRDAREVLAEAAAILLALPRFPDAPRFRELRPTTTNELTAEQPRKFNKTKNSL